MAFIKLSMAFINTSVFCNLSKKTLLPWTIAQLKEENHTFNDFFQEAIRPKLVHRDCRVVSAHIGPEKALLDLVDTNFLELPVINSFGRFLKYCVEGDDDDVALSQLQSTSPDAVLTFIPAIVEARNKKQMLYNDLIAMFKAHNALLRDDELNLYGKKVVTILNPFGTSII